jgi:hypothetical protein
MAADVRQDVCKTQDASYPADPAILHPDTRRIPGRHASLNRNILLAQPPAKKQSVSSPSTAGRSHFCSLAGGQYYSPNTGR